MARDLIEEAKQRMIEDFCKRLRGRDKEACIRYFKKRAEKEPKEPTPSKES